MNFLYIAHIPFVAIFFVFVLALALANWRNISSERSRDRGVQHTPALARKGAVSHGTMQRTDARRRGRSSKGT
jgi:hypothetical protein